MKKYIIGFIFGAIIFGSIGVIAGVINANDISYDSTHTVKDKIDDLYTKIDEYKEKFDTLTLTFTTQSGTSSAWLYISKGNNYGGIGKLYKYYKITKLEGINGTTCSSKVYNYITQEYVNANTNIQYATDTYDRVEITKGSGGTRCNATVILYNESE